MEESFWVMVAIILVIVFLGVVFGIINKFSKKKRPVDYFGIFIMGVIWLIIGVPLENYALLILGAMFTIVGLAHKGLWDQNKIKWKKLNKKEKATRIKILVGILIVIIIAFVLYSLLIRKII